MADQKIGTTTLKADGGNGHKVEVDGKYVVAVIWYGSVKNNSVGHVFLGDMNGDVLTSQFPAHHVARDKNGTKSWSETVEVEEQKPDAAYKIYVPNAKGLDSQAAIERSKTWWDWWPTNDDEETNCVVAAQHALSVGGRYILYSPKGNNKALPAIFGMQLWELSMLPGSQITRLDTIPWDSSVNISGDAPTDDLYPDRSILSDMPEIPGVPAYPI